MTIETLREEYETICNLYIMKFCLKQNMSYEKDMWVGGDVGGTILIGDYFLNFDVIVLDMNTKQPKGLILEWYNETMEDPTKWINYKSYTMGLRQSEIKDV